VSLPLRKLNGIETWMLPLRIGVPPGAVGTRGSCEHGEVGKNLLSSQLYARAEKVP
jgi:hypothetical protein